jgi:hypothetical protein
MLTAYNALAVRCWEDPGARRKFAESPRDALAAYGWEVGPETRVTIEFVALDADARPIGPDQIVAHWRRGLELGDLRIKIAEEPPEVEAGELDEGELTSVSAGAYNVPAMYPT